MAEGLRARQKRGRVERILAATRELIRADPERPPTVEAIAERAEVAPATVFNLVGPRERIWAALADEALRAAEEQIAASAEDDPRKRARMLVETTLDTLLADAPVHRLVLSNWSASGALLERDPTSGLRRCLEAGRASGEVAADIDVDALARHIATACTGAAHQWAAGIVDEAELRRRCLTAVDVTFAAARAR